MNVIVVGCGRVGAELAFLMSRRGHDVTVIDHVGSSFSHLDPDYRGRTIEAEPLAEGVLEKAGVREAHALAAVTNSDAVNAVVAHVARHTYGVPNVVARNYDPRWRVLHEAMGLLSVSSTAWGAQRIEELLERPRLRAVFSAGNGEVELYEVTVPEAWAGPDAWPSSSPGSPARSSRSPTAAAPASPSRGSCWRRGTWCTWRRRTRARRSSTGASGGGLSMRILIAGGGRTGATLARTLHAQKHEVWLVEHRPNVLAHLHRELPTELIYEGNPNDPRTLELARITEVQVLVASLSSDAENLSLCFIAREHFQVPRTIATINDPRFAWLFGPRFHVDVAVNQADILAGLIEQELSVGDMMTLLKLRKGSYSLVSETLPAGAPAVGRALRDLAFPAERRRVRDPAPQRRRDPARRRALRGGGRGARPRRRGVGGGAGRALRRGRPSPGPGMSPPMIDRVPAVPRRPARSGSWPSTARRGRSCASSRAR